MVKSARAEAGSTGDAARLLLASARERFSAAAADLLLPEDARLTQWQRTTAASLMQRLVRSIEDALRAEITDRLNDNAALHASLGSPRVEIALPILERAGALRDADLSNVLVRRLEEHRYWKEHATEAGEDCLTAMARDSEPEIAREAMALLIARSRRFDRFQEPLIGQSDLPAELQHRLVWMVAAALRQYMVQHHSVSSGRVDAVVSEAATGVIARHDEGKTLEASCMRLARALQMSGRLEGQDIARLLENGQLPLFIAALAVRCALDYPAAWEVLSDLRGRGAALLLKSAGIDRESVAWILLMLSSRGRLFSGQAGDAAAAQLDFYDGLTDAGARETLLLWRADPGYRSAIARLSTRRTPGMPQP